MPWEYDIYRIIAFLLGPLSVLISVKTRMYAVVLVPYCLAIVYFTIFNMWGAWSFLLLLLALAQFGTYVWWSVYRHKG